MDKCSEQIFYQLHNGSLNNKVMSITNIPDSLNAFSVINSENFVLPGTVLVIARSGWGKTYLIERWCYNWDGPKYISRLVLPIHRTGKNTLLHGQVVFDFNSQETAVNTLHDLMAEIRQSKGGLAVIDEIGLLDLINSQASCNLLKLLVQSCIECQTMLVVTGQLLNSIPEKILKYFPSLVLGKLPLTDLYDYPGLSKSINQLTSPGEWVVADTALDILRTP